MVKKDKWSALSMKDRAALIDIYVKSGITDLGEIRKSYNGIPYRDFNTSEYDYFNAYPDNAPTKEGEHWTSRNPYTGRLLKREDHPTFDLMIEGEKQAGYKIIRGYNGELYSIPNEPTNYVENYNSFDYGGPKGEGTATYNHPRYNHEEEAAIYSYLREKGVPHTQASAIMGNIAVESMLDPHITQIGGGGGYGLIQATDQPRKNNFINYDGQPYEFGSKLDPETQRQLDYIIDKGLNTYTIGEWRKVDKSGARDVRKEFLKESDIIKASDLFTKGYLRPGKPHTKRRQSMSTFYNEKYENPFENEYNDAFLFK